MDSPSETFTLYQVICLFFRVLFKSSDIKDDETSSAEYFSHHDNSSSFDEKDIKDDDQSFQQGDIVLNVNVTPSNDDDNNNRQSFFSGFFSRFKFIETVSLLPENNNLPETKLPPLDPNACQNNLCLCLCCICVFWIEAKPHPVEQLKYEGVIYDFWFLLRKGFHILYKSFFYFSILMILYILSFWIPQVFVLIGFVTVFKNLFYCVRHNLRTSHNEFRSYMNPDRGFILRHPKYVHHWEDCNNIYQSVLNCLKSSCFCCCNFSTCFVLSAHLAYKEGNPSLLVDQNNYIV